MDNIHHLQIPVVLVVTDADYYPLPVEPIDNLAESLAQLEAMMQEVA
jgi:hypothetical protein